MNKRPSEKVGHNVIFAPVPLKFKVKKKARSSFYEIGRLFCTPIHSHLSLCQHRTSGERGLRVVVYALGVGVYFANTGLPSLSIALA